MNTDKVVKIIIVVAVGVLLLAAFGLLDDVLELVDEPVVTQAIELFNDTQASETTQAPAPVAPEPYILPGSETSQANNEYAGPILPDADYSSMSLFKDRYEVVKLASIADGDTAFFIVGGTKYRTRFLAIDTPEVDPNLREVEPWGKAASAFTKDALKGASEIILELDPNSNTFDKYDRLLAWVWIDGELHNFNIVEQGLAEVAYLYGNYLHTRMLQYAQSGAEQAGIKIWGELDPDYKK